MEEPCDNSNHSNPSTGGLIRRPVALASVPFRPADFEGKLGVR